MPLLPSMIGWQQGEGRGGEGWGGEGREGGGGGSLGLFEACWGSLGQKSLRTPALHNKSETENY